jgi:hypothetical protein
MAANCATFHLYFPFRVGQSPFRLFVISRSCILWLTLASCRSVLKPAFTGYERIIRPNWLLLMRSRVPWQTLAPDSFLVPSKGITGFFDTALSPNRRF